MLLVVNFPAESLLACSKLTSPALSFTLGLHYLCVNAALRWYHSREDRAALETLQLHRAPACMARTGVKLPSSRWLCAGIPLWPHQHPLGIIYHLLTCASFCLLLLHQDGWTGSSSIKGLLWLLQTASPNCCCKEVATGML